MFTSRRITTLITAAGLVAAGAPAAHAADPLQTMRVPEAIQAAGQLSAVTVMPLDTGIDLDHPFFADRLFKLPFPTKAPDPDGTGTQPNVKKDAPGWDLIGTNAPGELKGDADPSDPDGGTGHGTLVSGVLGTVSPNAKFLAMRTCWDNDECFQYVQESAIKWSASRGVRVVSMSWLSGDIEDGLRDAIKAHSQMLFVTIPSGNGGAFDADGDNPQPCGQDLPNVLCVSTSSANDGLDCGAFGPKSVDVAVPTRGIKAPTNGGGTTTTGCATSFAAPAAAGVASILFGAKPDATAAEVKAAIVASARKVPAWKGKSVSGGIIDAAAALQTLKTGVAPEQPEPSADELTLDATRAGFNLRVTASADAQLTGTIRRAGQVRKTVNRALAAGQTVTVGVPKHRGTYKIALTATDASGQQVTIKRTVKR